MTLTLLHTAESHCAKFASILEQIDPEARMTQLVREDLLARATQGISPELTADISGTVQALDGPVICTCSTIGSVAEQAGAIRVDWPMMQRAAEIGGPVLMIYCLESTREPSLTLLHRAFTENGEAAEVTLLPLTQHWALFENGETERFAEALARDVRGACQQVQPRCVVLAQASMSDAAALLCDLGIPILSSPELALRSVLDGI